MTTKFFGGLLLVALAASGIHAYATNQCAEAQAPAAVQSTQSVIYGTVYDSVYPKIASIGQTILFTIDSTWNYPYTVDMFVSNPKNEDEPLEDSSRFTILSKTNSSAQIIFNKEGTYYVNFKVYDSAGELVASYRSYEVYVGY